VVERAGVSRKSKRSKRCKRCKRRKREKEVEEEKEALLRPYRSANFRALCPTKFFDNATWPAPLVL
jgi:hypothetical protein